MNILSDIFQFLLDTVCGVPMITVILVAGLTVTIVLRGVQFRRFGFALRHCFSGAFGKKSKKGSVTPFQAMCTALAATVGTGSIAGVAGAISIGGPGAVFWMWVSALFGMATKYSEITLAVHFREKNSAGDWVGGPMYYIRNGLGKKWNWLAKTFAAFCGIAAFSTGNMTQVNTIASSVNTAVQSFLPQAEAYRPVINLVIGIVLAGIVALVLFGGITRIGKVTEKLIPFMSAVYILGTLIAVLINYRSVGEAFRLIFSCAFDPRAMGGGLAGISILKVMEKGIGRGIFSNEAGLGSAPIAHASSDTDSPVRQGMFGILEVFLATFVICTLTALTILTSGVTVPYGSDSGAALTTQAVASVFGSAGASIFMALAVILFALSTILGWGVYGARSVEFLFGTRSIRVYQVIYIAVAVVGAVVNLDIVWSIADLTNCFMAIPNLIGVVALSGVVKKLTKEYFSRPSRLPAPETPAPTK